MTVANVEVVRRRLLHGWSLPTGERLEAGAGADYPAIEFVL